MGSAWTRPIGRLSALAAFAARLVILVLTAGAYTPAIQAQTPEDEGTPEPPVFLLIARVEADEWATLASAPTTPEAGAELAGPDLLAALREGGYVIYFRHARTDFSQQDRDRNNLSTCATQRNLSAEGRAQARLIGESIEALAIPIGDVLSGEYCRTRETAELAFGRVTVTRDLTSRVATSSEKEEQARIEALHRLLATPPAPGTNTVLVGHQFNLRDAAGVSLAEGEAAIFRPLATAATSTPSPGQ